MAAITRLASDTATLAQAVNENVMQLVKNDIIPSEDLVIGDVELADFDGSAALDVVLGTQPTGFEPGTDDSIIHIEPAAGTWRWETTGLTNLPQTIYGWVLMNAAKDTVLASGKFETPLDLTIVNQVVEVDDNQLALPANSFI